MMIWIYGALALFCAVTADRAARKRAWGWFILTAALAIGYVYRLFQVSAP